jgi:hypothetical protein
MTISKETLSLISTFKNPIIELLTDLKDEVKFYFDNGIIKYVENIREKFMMTKTFLYRHENVNFYDVFFPVTLNNKKKKQYKIEDIQNLFKDSSFITIIGNAGSGKSMLLRHVFLLAIKQVVKIPIVIELRNLNEFEGSFFDYINKSLSGKKIAPNEKILERILSNGDFIFLLDGYDEIYSDNKNKSTTELIDFIDTFSKNYFLITSRPGANVESLPRFESYFVNELSTMQIKQFINMQLQRCEDIKLAKKIIAVVDRPENKDYNSYLSSPLLLSMFIMTFNSYPELPKTKSKFYWNVYDTLCTKHDSFTKHGGYQHERKTGLQNEELQNILKWFSYTSLFKGKYSFDNQYFSDLLGKIKVKLNLDCNLLELIEDLTVAISIIMIDGLEYKFPHKSLQEYFTALLIRDQTEEVKKDIYSKKLEQLYRHTFDGNENLWNLCQELDYNSFVKYFIIIHLEDFLSKIDKSSEEAICKSFIIWSGFKQGLIINEDSKVYTFNGFQRKGNFLCGVLEYLEILDFHELSRFSLSDEFQDHITLLLKNNIIIETQGDDPMRFWVDYENNWNEISYSSIIHLGIKDIIVNSIDKTEKLKCRLIAEIEFNEKSQSELLDL